MIVLTDLHGSLLFSWGQSVLTPNQEMELKSEQWTLVLSRSSWSGRNPQDDATSEASISKFKKAKISFTNGKNSSLQTLWQIIELQKHKFLEKCWNFLSPVSGHVVSSENLAVCSEYENLFLVKNKV